MHDNDPDIERAQDCDIQKDVWEIFVSDDRAIDADNECLLPETRDVLQDAPQVSRFHISIYLRTCSQKNKYGLFAEIQLISN